MKGLAFLAALAAANLATASQRIAQLYYQPVLSSAEAAPAPLPLADVQFDPSSPSTASVTTYEAPELLPPGQTGSEPQLVRIGLYNPKTSTWLSSTSVTSASTFSKGYSPHLILTVDTVGNVLGAGARGVRIDAGATRDFGPQAVVSVSGQGKTPDLGKPVVISPEGKKVEEEEKTMLQKYWWMIGIVVLLTLVTGGDGK